VKDLSTSTLGKVELRHEVLSSLECRQRFNGGSREVSRLLLDKSPLWCVDIMLEIFASVAIVVKGLRIWENTGNVFEDILGM